MSDLVRGRFHVTNPVWCALGQPVNATQSDIAVRSNLDAWGSPVLSDGAALATGVITAVAVPVEYGDVISKISVLVGATAEATGTHAWAALYSAPAAQGTPALLGTQSTDNTGAAAMGASARFDFTLGGTPVLITPTNAPQGYVWAAVCVTATTVPTLASFTLATAVAYPWFTNAPVKMGAITSGSALGATAPATLASPAAQAVTPVMFLS